MEPVHLVIDATGENAHDRERNFVRGLLRRGFDPKSGQFPTYRRQAALGAITGVTVNLVCAVVDGQALDPREHMYALRPILVVTDDGEIVRA